MKIVGCALALSFVVVSCGGASSSGADSSSSNSFPTAAYATVSSDSGAYRVEVRTSPVQPPVRGEVAIELVVTDAHGAPVDGLDLQVTPWMPAMGHGTSVTPLVTPVGEGAYRLSSVDMFMPGTWQLRLTLGGDQAMTTFDVQ